jgi:hypothetical protein
VDQNALCGLVYLGRETRDLDYKQAAAWNPTDKSACCAFVKDILAMANSLGGSIVIGVDDTSTGFVPTGLTSDALKSWESTRINNFIQSYASPPVNVQIAKPTCGTAQFVVLLIPQFRQSPHICFRDYPGVLTKPTLYVRTASNASEPVSAIQDMQDLIERAVRTRQDQLLEAMREILTGAAVARQPSDLEQFDAQNAEVSATLSDPFPGKGYDGYLTAAMFPARFDAQRFSIDDLRRAAAEASVTLRGRPFLYYQEEDQDLVVMNDGLRYELIGQLGFERLDFAERWNLKQSGLLVQRVLLLEEALRAQGRLERIVDPNTLTFYVTEAINSLVRLYTALEVENEDITLRITVEGVQGRALQVFWGSRTPLRPGHTAKEAVIRVEGVHPLAEWQAGLRDLATQMTFEIIRRFQVAGGISIREWVDKLLDRRL